MMRSYAVWIIVVLTTLGLVETGALRTDGSSAWRLSAEGEVGFTALGPPELTLATSLRAARGRLGLELTRSLEQTPSYGISVSETLSFEAADVEAKMTWKSGSSPQADITLGLDRVWGDVELQVGSSAQSLQWQLKGTAAWDPFVVKLSGLQGDLNGELAVEGWTVEWLPTPQSTVAATYKRTQSSPLEITIDVPLAQDVTAAGTIGFDRRHSRTNWQWQTLALDLQRSPVRLRVAGTPSGWEWAELDAQSSVTPSLKVGAGTRFARGGWERTDIDVTWSPGLSSEWQLRFTQYPEDDWRLRTSGSWHPLELPLSLDGEGTLRPGGLGDARLSGRATPGDLFVDVLVSHSTNSWLVDLSGKISRGAWTWGGTSSWLAPFGWDRGSVGLSRDVE